MHEIRLFLHELESMPEYSSTIPTGTVMWKMWRRREQNGRGEPIEEFVGQYVPPTRPKDDRGRDQIGIRWFKVVLKHGPAPRIYNPPDWSNYEGYKRERAEERRSHQQQR